MHPVVMPGRGMVASGGAVRDGLALACWLDPKAVIAALDREIDARADDRKALTAEAKAARLAEIDAQILNAEREEEAVLQLALDQGAVILQRGDADPRAVLQVALA